MSWDDDDHPARRLMAAEDYRAGGLEGPEPFQSARQARDERRTVVGPPRKSATASGLVSAVNDDMSTYTTV